MRPSNNNKIFVRHNVKICPKEPISHFLVQNGSILLCLQRRKLQHIRIQSPNMTDIPLQLAPQDHIAHIFLDYRGIHAIVSTTMGENFYVNMKLVALKPLKKLKGHVISAIGWNSKFGSDSETGFIVLGTNKGVLMETSISSNGNQAYLKTLTNSIVQGTDLPISKLHIGPCSLDDDNNWMIIVCLPGRLYCITGTLNTNALNPQPSQPMIIGTVWSPALTDSQQSAVLSGFFSHRGQLQYHHKEDAANQSLSDFCVYPIAGDDYEIPSKYSWLNPSGISCGRIETNKNNGYEMICEEWHTNHKISEGTYDYPLDIALSEYHVLVLYPDRFLAISLLNQQVAFEDVFHTGPKVVGLARDSTSQFIWVFTEHAFFNYQPIDEARDVWRILLDRNEFAKAKKITYQMADPRPYQFVLKKEAAKFFAQQNFGEAAELLAKSDEPFENTVMKFLKYNSRESRNGLKRYLELKLESVDKTNRVQRDILVVWLLEIQLSELAELRRNAISNNEGSVDEHSNSVSFSQKGGQVKRLREELYGFLNRPNVSDSIGENRAAVYRLVTSHVDFETQLHIANKLKDHDVVIKIYLLQKDYKKALQIISTHPDPSLFYKYAEDFFEHSPVDFIIALINAGRTIKPARILSIFFNCQNSVEKSAAAFRYLNHAVEQKLADQATHDFLIKLFAEKKPNSLLEHLKRFGKNKRDVPYNVGRALTICLDKKLHECCVFLYCIEGLYEIAVKLALNIRIELAKECAIELNRTQAGELSPGLPDDDLNLVDMMQNENPTLTTETKKHVWLEIAKHMIHHNHDISSCMNLLRESNNVIKIQDILSFFPEFTRIEHFKQPLCECLKEHASKIQELQKEMSYVSESAAQLRSQIEKSRSSVITVRASDRCSHCSQHLLSRPFYIFNCRHFLHHDCLVEYLRQCFTKQETDLIDILLAQEQTLRAEVLVRTGRELVETQAKHAVLKRKIREFIASECPLCGHERLTTQLAKPIISESGYQKLVTAWEF